MSVKIVKLGNQIFQKDYLKKSLVTKSNEDIKTVLFCKSPCIQIMITCQFCRVVLSTVDVFRK